MTLPDGTVIRTRLTMFFHHEDGAWKVFGYHCSAGVPDEEVEEFSAAGWPAISPFDSRVKARLALRTMLSVKVSTKHQISVPSAARRALGIKAGDRLTVEIREDEIALRPRAGHAADRLYGLGRGMYGDAVAYVRALRDEWEE